MAIKRVKGMPITGGRTEMRPTRQVTSSQNQARQAQSQLSAPPAPFKTSSGPAQQPTGRMNGSQIGQPYVTASAPGPVKNSKPGSPIMSSQQLLKAVGQNRVPNYAGRAIHAAGDPAASPSKIQSRALIPPPKKNKNSRAGTGKSHDDLIASGNFKKARREYPVIYGSYK